MKIFINKNFHSLGLLGTIFKKIPKRHAWGMRRRSGYARKFYPRPRFSPTAPFINIKELDSGVFARSRLPQPCFSTSSKMASKGQRWVVDSGILRKKIQDEEPPELLVFGYSCKLFRDDEKAKLVDQGKHLIPWMGDSTHKIDRSVFLT